MNVRIDEEICQGHTLCAMAAPDVFGLRDDDGHAYILVSEFTPEMISAAKRASLTCPEQAIFIEE